MHTVPRLFRAHSVMLVTVLLVTALAATEAQSAPVREGSILASGPFTADCLFSPNCIVWLNSGCNPSLAGSPDSTVASSIVDVEDLAGSTRSLLVTLGSPTGLAPNGGGSGIKPQFFTSNCTVIVPDPPVPLVKPGQTIAFKLPSNAKWMTATGGYVVNVAWTLT